MRVFPKTRALPSGTGFGFILLILRSHTSRECYRSSIDIKSTRAHKPVVSSHVRALAYPLPSTRGRRPPLLQLQAEVVDTR